MKKLIASIAMGAMVFGATVTSVSAEEYEVKKGDSLWSIAKENHTTMDNLIEMNGMDSTTIQPNQKITINETYTVEKGDTLSGIGKDFDVSVKDIKKWNKLDSHIIGIGQELKIAGSDKQTDKKATKADEKQVEEKAPAAEESSPKEEPKAEATSSEEANSSEQPEGKTISVTSTAYTAKCDGCSGVTSTGVDLNSDPNAKVIAVDPSVIPLGSEVYVEGYGHATAADVGGAIKGNKIDLHVPTKDEANSWGVRTVDVTIIK